MSLGFNMIGNISANTGLGVQARQVVDLLIAMGHEIQVFDVNPGGGRSGHDQRFAHITVCAVNDLPHAINLFVLQPTAVFEFLAANYGFCFTPGRLNAAIVWWELPKIPLSWVAGFRAVDVVLAASDFVRGTFEANLSDTYIAPAPSPLFIPEKVRADREAYGLPANGVIFVTSFDPGSDPERKNPFATVRAFTRALGKSSEAYLVVKVNNPRQSGGLHPAIQQLHELSNDHPNILIVDRVMSYAETLSLYASCDVFVSLHRAEGLGLGLMEAMALGKPVIATAWSGNMSFMDHTNSCLVSYNLVPVKSKLPAYSMLVGSAQWAEPSEEDAAAWMQELVRNRYMREHIGQAAKQSMAEYQANAKRGHFLDELAAVTEHRAFMPRRPPPPAAALWEASRIGTPSPLTVISEAVSRQWNKHVAWRLHRT